MEPDVQELFDAIASCRQNAVDWNGIVYRSVGMEYANSIDFLSGKGAAEHGGRWNPRGIESIYASCSVITAVREAYQNFFRFGFPPNAIRPRVLAAAEVNLRAVLDLTDRQIRRQLGFTLRDLLSEDWLGIQEEGDESWTQAIGRGAYIAGYEGLLAPSSQDRPDGITVVIFPARLPADSKLQLLGADELPRRPTAGK